MLNYKHASHAGNHADVLKHVCLIYFIKSIKYSYNSILYIDTHAGRSSYILNNEYVQKKIKNIKEVLKKCYLLQLMIHIYVFT